MSTRFNRQQGGYIQRLEEFVSKTTAPTRKKTSTAAMATPEDLPENNMAPPIKKVCFKAYYLYLTHLFVVI